MSAPAPAALGAPQVQGKKVISDKHARDFVEEQKKRGIIYLSRIPRFMKPVTVRQLLARYGEVTRIYIVPEESAVRAARVRKGGSRRENWIEGWVEYADKQTAKLVASQLNTTPVDPKGKGLYGGELWTMKYLSGFKWAHLKEKLAYEKRMRASKVRQSVANVRAETEDYKTRTEISKRLQRQGAGESAAAAGDSMGGVKRSFNQLTPLDAEGRAVMGFTSVAEDGFERGDAGRRGGDVAPDVLAAVFGGQRSGSHKKPRRKAASA